MKTRPLVSIIVPNYNHSPFLPERLDSIKQQTFQDSELIVMDDASTDNSLEVIRRNLGRQPYRLLVNNINSGSPCSQWLKGIQQSRGEYIWIAESDDSCSPIFLEQMMRCLQNDVVLAYCRTNAIDSNGDTIESMPFWPDTFDRQLWQRTFIMSAADLCRNYMVRGNVIANASSVVFRRPDNPTLKELSLRTESLLYVGDWLYWVYYLLSSGGRIHFNAAELSNFRFHDQTTRISFGRKAVERKRMQEYSHAITTCLASIPERPFLYWLRLASRGYWDWIFNEYQYRFQPTRCEIILGRGFKGALRLGFLIRILEHRSLRLRCWNSSKD